MQPPAPPLSGGPPPEQQDALALGGTPPPARRLQRPHPSRRVVIGVLVLLVGLLTVVTALVARPHSDTAEPGVAATAYFVAQDRHDYAARWALMTPRWQAAWGTESAFARDEAQFYRDTQGPCCQLSQVVAQQTTVNADQAVVQVARIYTGNRGTATDNAYLRRINGRWLVDWAGEKPPPGWSAP